MTCMPNARARCATSWPIRPKPAMPSVLPRSSVPSKVLLVPAAVLHRAIGRRDRPRQRQHQRPGVLGDADAVGAGRVDDENAAGAGGFDVDVVDAGAGARDDPQPRRRGDQRGIDFRRAPHQQRVRIRQIVGQLRPAIGRCGHRRSTRRTCSSSSADAGRLSATMIFMRRESAWGIGSDAAQVVDDVPDLVRRHTGSEWLHTGLLDAVADDDEDFSVS